MPTSTRRLGLFLLGWTIFTAYMTIAAIRTTGAVFAVFVALTVTFLFLTIGAFANVKPPSVSTWTKLGGYVGIVTAILAWYASFAGVTNSTFGRSILPTYPVAERRSRPLTLGWGGGDGAAAPTPGETPAAGANPGTVMSGGQGERP